MSGRAFTVPTPRQIRRSIRERRRQEASCPSFHDHTPCPEGYLDWHAWAKRMMRTHRQIRCTGCQRFEIWVPRKRRTSGP